MIELDVSYNEDDLFNYKVYHKYHSVSGIMEILLGLVLAAIAVVSIGKTEVTYTVTLAFFAALFVVIIPVQLKTSCKKAGKSGKKTMINVMQHYKFSDDGIIITSGDMKAECSWKDVYRVKDTGKSVLLYFTPVMANIIPKRCISDSIGELKTLIAKNLDQHKMKL